MRKMKWLATALAGAVVLAGCGGGGGADTTPKTSVGSVKIFGDSLMDSGTFGYKFTIQSADPANPFQVFPERIATSFGFSSMCPFFLFNGTTFVANPKAGCTNYSVAGGRVNNLTNSSAPSNAVPFAIPYQLGAAATSFAASDFVIIDGGSNDLADLTGAYLGATTPAGIGTFIGAITPLVPNAASIVGAAPSASSLGAAGGAYAQALAATLVASVKGNVVAKGVGKVLVVNSSDITKTPRFQAVLTGISATAGAAQSAAVQSLVQTWTQAYNAALAAGFAGTNVQIFDFYAQGGLIFANPAQYGITNASTPACPIVAGGIDTVTGQASLSYGVTVAACNSASMSANIPKGETSPNWWKSYGFSDNFHPTPALHQLIAQSISVQLAKLGWL